MKQTLVTTVVLLCVTFINVTFAHEVRKSTNYKMLCDQFTAASVASASTSYALQASMGSSQPSGIMESSNYVLVSGCREYIVDLSTNMNDGESGYFSGHTYAYQIIAQNNGMNEITGANLVDNFASGLTNIQWSCTAPSGASCTPTSGSGNIQVLLDIPPGAEIHITARVNTGSHTGPLENTATISLPNAFSDNNMPNNSVTDTNIFEPETLFRDSNEGDF